METFFIFRTSVPEHGFVSAHARCVCVCVCMCVCVRAHARTWLCMCVFVCVGTLVGVFRPVAKKSVFSRLRQTPPSRHKLFLATST